MLICKRLCRGKPAARLWQAFITVQLGSPRIIVEKDDLAENKYSVQRLSAVVSPV